jgi:sterol desaturase/sphingolipid hydroxylase (fatty acid hydroxylase superfamily)
MWILFLAIGAISWTFLEYMMHRFLGHEHKGKNFFKTEHTQHHAKVHYFAPAYKKLLAAAIVAIVIFLLVNMFNGALNSAAFVIGLLGMYSLYEITHYRYHASKPLIAPFIILRKHHFYHHFHNPKMNHGVTTRFWDRVFSTFKEVDKVHIPQKMSMTWLVKDGEIRTPYVKHFHLNKR